MLIDSGQQKGLEGNCRTPVITAERIRETPAGGAPRTSHPRLLKWLREIFFFGMGRVDMLWLLLSDEGKLAPAVV